MRIKLNLILIVFALSFTSVGKLLAQRTIGAPDLVEFSACADPMFNQFNAIATLSPGDALPNDNQYILQLSDPNGSFDDASLVTELARVNGPNNGSTSELEINFVNFAIPEEANSDTYKLRVVTSSEPQIISALSGDESLHFFRNDLNLFLNERRDVIFCNVSSFSKTIEIRIEDLDGNEVNADDFSWDWFKDGVQIAGESGTSIEIDQVGEYFARIPLGGCQNFFVFEETNRVEVLFIDVASVFIESASGFSFCPNDPKELSSSVINNRYRYQWLKDGEPIEGANTPNLTLDDNNFGGDYTLTVEFSEDCSLTTDPVTVINEGSSITQTLPENLILLPTQTIQLEVATDAPEGSIVSWFAQTSIQQQGPLMGNTTSIEARFVGEYRVEILAMDPCNSFLVSRTELFAPVGFEVNIGTQNESESCDIETFNLELKEILGETTTGLMVPLTTEQLEFFDYEWFKDGVATGVTTQNIEVDRSDGDAIYSLNANLRTGEFSDIVSNEFSVAFLPSDIAITANPESFSETVTEITLSVPQDNNYMYQWFTVVDEQETNIEGATTNTLTINAEGEYFVRIITPFCTTTLSIVIGNVPPPPGVSEFIPNVITPFGSIGQNDTWILPSTLANQQDVEVTIYDTRGQVDFTGVEYQNNWPMENSKSSGENPVYYYIITRNNSVVRKGSITVMR